MISFILVDFACLVSEERSPRLLCFADLDLKWQLQGNLMCLQHGSTHGTPSILFPLAVIPGASYEDQHNWIIQNDYEQTGEHSSIFRKPKLKRNKQAATKLIEKSI